MTRAAIYARYSSDLQSEASIDDQVRLCRERIAREGWTLAATYADRAMSGASALRPGYQKLMEDARAGSFDVVVAEAMDRLSRDQEDIAALHKRLRFSGIRIVTLAEGEVTELHVGLKGTMNAVFLKDLAQKTWRGLEGRVRQGRSGGGICYGYDPVRELGPGGEVTPGLRRINPAEAGVVRRIFRDYARGQSPRAIARALNRENLPGPSGKSWTASTIHGNRERGTGILNNELYIGRLVWNRLRYSKDPATGRRISRLNPPSTWITQEVPELRIVEQPLWDEVRKRQQDLTLPASNRKIRNALNTRHRARHLLSGLLKCGVCGSGYTSINRDRYACSAHVNRGDCANHRTIGRVAIERRILDGLRDKLLAPELVAEFVREYQVEWNRQMAARRSDRTALETGLAETERRIAQILSAIEQGVVTASTRDRLLALEAERDRIAERLRNRAEPPAPVSLHPNLAEVYRRKVADLQAALDVPETRAEAAAILRGLIDCVVLHPGEGRGEVRAELYGALATLLHLEADKKTRTSGDVRVSLVAGTGFEPVTFRL